MPLRKRLLILIPLAAVAAFGVWWLVHRPVKAGDALTLYGNVDVRQMQLAFNDQGRIAQVLVQEGARVHAGQPLARLDDSRYVDAAARADAALAGARSELDKLHAGSRPQEIAQARAGVQAASAAVRNARATFARQERLVRADFLPRQALDNATQALQTAQAQLDGARQGLSLALQGPRKEDIAAAQAQVAADAAAQALARRELADATLVAPAAGVVQDRILEPGDMAAPQVPVLTVALDDPVWARVYAPEKALGQLAPGMRAVIRSDSFPGRTFNGWIGFISPTAEFTPKSVQTTELRTELVYRVHVYACNPDGSLRLGMPVTVEVPLHDNPPQTRPGHVCGH